MSDPPPERLTKRGLVVVSHAIESAACAVAEDGPMAVVALFQRPPYFRREEASYRRIAARAAATVVAAAGLRSDEGFTTVDLSPTEPLAGEWSVVVLTPRFGAALVAHDREKVDAAAESLEGGRLFDGWWSLRRDTALRELLRLRDALAERLPAATLHRIDDVVARTRDLPAGQGEARSAAALRVMMNQVEARTRDLAVARRRRPAAEGEEDGRHDEGFLRRWASAGGTTASGTLPVALIGVRLSSAYHLPDRFARRVDTAAYIDTIRAMTRHLRPVDRAIRFGAGDTLLVMPSLSMDDAIAVARRITSPDTDRSGSPAGQARATVVVAVTRQRPLPTTDLLRALDWAAGQGIPIATVGPHPETADSAA